MVPLGPFLASDIALIVAVHMAANDQMHEISDLSVLSRGHTADGDKQGVIETDLDAVDALVVSHQRSEEIPGTAAGKAPPPLGGVTRDTQGGGRNGLTNLSDADVQTDEAPLCNAARTGRPDLRRAESAKKEEIPGRFTVFAPRAAQESRPC